MALVLWLAAGVVVGRVARYSLDSAAAGWALSLSGEDRITTSARAVRWATFPFVPRDRALEEAYERAQALGLGSRAMGNDLMRARLKTRWVSAADQLGPRPRNLAWPVQQGTFVRGFGSGEGGYHMAVDLGAAEGTGVLAVARGIVAYADNGIRGYGNSVFIVHPGGLISFYAHNAANLVVPGQVVRRGELIGRVGNTGISRGPHLHFEFMFQRQNCDPWPLFEPGGQGIRFYRPKVQAEWTGDGPPRGVRCGKRRRHPHSRYEHSL